MRGVLYRLQRGGGGKEERSLGVWASGGKKNQANREGGGWKGGKVECNGERLMEKKEKASNLKSKGKKTKLFCIFFTA